jgi:hypothetical protein
MPMFVHLTPESRVALIRRNGIGRLRKPSGEHPGGIFAMPVTRNFYVSHQWLRELKRRGQGSIAGVYFRIADDESVWVGHYNQAHRLMTAAAAAAEFSASENREGWEVIVPRRVASRPRRSTGSGPCRRSWVGDTRRVPRASRRSVRANIALAASTGQPDCGRDSDHPTLNLTSSHSGGVHEWE